MKTLTTLTCALAAVGAVAFCAPNAKASEVTTYKSDLNFTLTFTGTTNYESSETEHFKLVTRHITNKEVLEALEGDDFYGDPFPTGAKLVIGWDHGGDVLVVDSTGSNVLYDASEGTIDVDGADGTYAYLRIEPVSDEGAVSGSEAEDTDAEDVTGYNDGKVEFKDYHAGTVFDFEAKNVSSTEHFTENADGTSWSDKDTIKIGDQGDQSFEGYEDLTVKGTITATGSGKGDAEEYLPYFEF